MRNRGELELSLFGGDFTHLNYKVVGVDVRQTQQDM
jgi:hypothetical protein